MDNKPKTNQKSKINWMIGGISAAVLGFGAVGAIIFGNQDPSVNGFDANQMIDDSVSVEIVEPVVSFDVSKALAVGNIGALETATDIDSFRRLMERNRQEAESLNEGKIVIPKIVLYFGYKSSELDAPSRALLEEYARVFLETNKEARILIEGYACNIGTNEANNLISKKRAEGARKTLEDYGVSEQSIGAEWYGKTKNSEYRFESINQYRRVEISIE